MCYTLCYPREDALRAATPFSHPSVVTDQSTRRRGFRPPSGERTTLTKPTTYHRGSHVETVPCLASHPMERGLHAIGGTNETHGNVTSTSDEGRQGGMSRTRTKRGKDKGIRVLRGRSVRRSKWRRWKQRRSENGFFVSKRHVRETRETRMRGVGKRLCHPRNDRREHADHITTRRMGTNHTFEHDKDASATTSVFANRRFRK